MLNTSANTALNTKFCVFALAVTCNCPFNNNVMLPLSTTVELVTYLTSPFSMYAIVKYSSSVQPACLYSHAISSEFAKPVAETVIVELCLYKLSVAGGFDEMLISPPPILVSVTNSMLYSTYSYVTTTSVSFVIWLKLYEDIAP